MAALFTIDENVIKQAQISNTDKAVLLYIVGILNAAVDAGASEADLAKLAAVTASAAELNATDNATSTNDTAGKTAILGTAGALALGGALTATTSIGIGSAVLTEAEMEMLDTLTAGVATALKAAVLGASKNLDVLGLPVGGLKIGVAASEVAVTASAAELNILTGATATAAELNYNDIATLGVGAASKTVALDADARYRLPSTGTLFNAGKQTKAQAAPAAKTVTAGISAAELVAGLITTTGATAPSEHQLPTGTEIDAAFPGIATGDSFEFVIVNTGAGAGDNATITVNTDVTIVGNPTIGATDDESVSSGSGTFIARRSNANAYVVYRKS